MQCNQSYCGDLPIFYEHLYPYNAAKCSRLIPDDVIGEGDVSSIIYPDGTIRYYFVPTIRCAPNVYNPNSPNYYNPCWNTNTGVWFIKNVSNPIPLAIFNQQFQRFCGSPNLKSHFSSHCNVNSVLTPGFQVKFHNDDCTSTTDLHYFYPCLRPNRYELFPKVGAAVQVNEPPQNNTVCHYEIVCAKPCQCFLQNNSTKEANTNVVVCTPSKTAEANQSHMSIDEATLKQDCCEANTKKKSSFETLRLSRPRRKFKTPKACVSSELKCSCECISHSEKIRNAAKNKKTCHKNTKTLLSCDCDISSNSKHNTKSEQYIGECDLSCDCNSIKTTKQSTSKHKLTRGACECNSKPAPIHKLVTTYTDQASGCIADVGRETQTNSTNNIQLSENSSKVQNAVCRNSAQTSKVNHSDKCCPNTVPIRKVCSVLHCNNVEAEMWYPKTLLGKKAMKCKSSKELTAIHNNDNSLDSENASSTKTDYETDE